MDPSEHQALAENLPLLVLEALCAEEAAALQAHVDFCADCRAEVTALRRTTELLREGLAAEPLPVLTDERRQRVLTGSLQRPWLVVMRQSQLLAAAAAVVVLGVTVIWLTSSLGLSSRRQLAELAPAVDHALPQGQGAPTTEIVPPHPDPLATLRRQSKQLREQAAQDLGAGRDAPEQTDPFADTDQPLHLGFDLSSPAVPALSSRPSPATTAAPPTGGGAALKLSSQVGDAGVTTIAVHEYGRRIVDPELDTVSNTSGLYTDVFGLKVSPEAKAKPADGGRLAAAESGELDDYRTDRSDLTTARLEDELVITAGGDMTLDFDGGGGAQHLTRQSTSVARKGSGPDSSRQALSSEGESGGITTLARGNNVALNADISSAQTVTADDDADLTTGLVTTGTRGGYIMFSDVNDVSITAGAGDIDIDGAVASTSRLLSVEESAGEPDSGIVPSDAPPGPPRPAGLSSPASPTRQTDLSLGDDGDGLVALGSGGAGGNVIVGGSHRAKSGASAHQPVRLEEVVVHEKRRAGKAGGGAAVTLNDVTINGTDANIAFSQNSADDLTIQSATESSGRGGGWAMQVAEPPAEQQRGLPSMQSGDRRESGEKSAEVAQRDELFAGNISGAAEATSRSFDFSVAAPDENDARAVDKKEAVAVDSATAPDGQITRTWFATDDSGNAAPATQEVPEPVEPAPEKTSYFSKLPIVGKLFKDAPAAAAAPSAGPAPAEETAVEDLRRARQIAPQAAVDHEQAEAEAVPERQAEVSLKERAASRIVAENEAEELQAVQTVNGRLGRLAEFKPPPAAPPVDDEPLPAAPLQPAPPVNPFHMAETDHLSTFALEADTASYALTRRYIRKGYRPPPAIVRMEEFVNAFDYNYPASSDRTFSVHTEAAPSPFGKGLVLLKIGVRGKVVGRDGRKPAHLIFVVDSSGSMARDDRMPLVKLAMTYLLDQLDARDRITIVTYGSQVHLLAEATPASRRQQLQAAIESIECSTATNLIAGVEAGYQLARRHFRAGEINRVVLCSDGVANVGPSAADAVLTTVAAQRQQGITFTSVGVGAGSFNDQVLEQLANKGDGNYVFVDSAEEARRIFVDEMSATLQTIARNVKIQVEFNPQRVRRYRLIGYENRAVADQDFRNDAVDGGEIGSGQSGTALYELELWDKRETAAADLGTVYVRHLDLETGAPHEFATRLSSTLVRERSPAESPRFFLAAGVAEFAELMRQSEHARGGSLAAVEQVLIPVANALPLDRQVQELLQLVQQAQGLPVAQ